MDEMWFVKKAGGRKTPKSEEYNEWKMYVAGKLSALRIANGETRLEVANAIGVNRHAVEAYERGEREIPAYLVSNYCSHYGVEPNAIIPYGHKDKVKDEESIELTVYDDRE